MATDLSIITVVTRSAEVPALSSLLDSIADSDFSGALEVIVVSNGLSSEELKAVAKRHSDRARFLWADRNLGYAGANNWGMLKSGGRLILLLNPDIVVNRDSLSRLVAFVDGRPDVGAATGKLIGPDGQVQVGFNARGLPTFLSAVFDALLLHRAFPWTRLSRHYLGRDIDYERPQRIEQPAGACLLVRRELVEQVGVMDETFFPIWYEDVDWCMRMRSYGWQLWYTPDAVFYHAGAVSTGDWPKGDAALAKYHNFAYLCKKHFGVPLSILIVLSIAVGMLLRSLLVLLGALLRRDMSQDVKNFQRGDTMNAVKGYMRIFWLSVTARL